MKMYTIGTYCIFYSIIHHAIVWCHYNTEYHAEKMIGNPHLACEDMGCLFWLGPLFTKMD